MVFGFEAPATFLTGFSPGAFDFFVVGVVFLEVLAFGADDLQFYFFSHQLLCEASMLLYMRVVTVKVRETDG